MKEMEELREDQFLFLCSLWKMKFDAINLKLDQKMSDGEVEHLSDICGQVLLWADLKKRKSIKEDN